MFRIVVTPDVQLPFHNPAMLRKHIAFIGDIQPDEVLNIGDLTDFPEPSRWSKDTRAEFEGSIKTSVEATKRAYFEPIRQVYSGPVGMHIGNHDARPLDYQRRYAPALDYEDKRESPFYYGNLLDFDGFGVADRGDFYEFAKGWESTHGHKVPASLSQIPGLTALNSGRKRDTSIVCGHTHRLAAVPGTVGGAKRERTIWGVEVGNFMDKRKAGYLDKKGGYANWQSGFAVIDVDGPKVKVDIIPVYKDGSFIFEGRKWD
ncbi:metallophosphoesterase [Glycomyces mayteni]|uniref:Metallophosphoesterase n=1 Tax=Glycomyces mayteni TaxID=543887 RepID=A0ABW2D184_9ACTN|nr:hypothetical protein GCM10025732_47860 [Glycomyces mayteni]